MPHPMIRSWAFAWAAEGRSDKTMREMTRFVVRFEAAFDKDLMTATRGDCEAFIASHESPFQRNHA